jgi:hypothetical protein
VNTDSVKLSNIPYTCRLIGDPSENSPSFGGGASGPVTVRIEAISYILQARCALKHVEGLTRLRVHIPECRHHTFRMNLICPLRGGIDQGDYMRNGQLLSQDQGLDVVDIRGFVR